MWKRNFAQKRSSMYRRLSYVALVVALAAAITVYAGVEEYAKSGQFPKELVVIAGTALLVAIVLAVLSSRNMGNDPIRSEVITDRDWIREDRRRQLKDRRAALRDTMKVRSR